jgi:hypothetical protein
MLHPAGTADAMFGNFIYLHRRLADLFDAPAVGANQLCVLLDTLVLLFISLILLFFCFYSGASSSASSHA